MKSFHANVRQMKTPLHAQKPTGKVTVLMADDNSTMLKSLCKLLGSDGRIEVIGQARDGREAVEMARKLKPDVILMDIAMPLLNGFDATEQILATNLAAKVLMLTAHNVDAYVERAIELGAVGFVPKQTASTTLVDAICEAAKGNTYYKPAIGKGMARRGNRRAKGTFTVTG